MLPLTAENSFNFFCFRLDRAGDYRVSSKSAIVDPAQGAATVGDRAIILHSTKVVKPSALSTGVADLYSTVVSHSPAVSEARIASPVADSYHAVVVDRSKVVRETNTFASTVPDHDFTPIAQSADVQEAQRVISRVDNHNCATVVESCEVQQSSVLSVVDSQGTAIDDNAIVIVSETKAAAAIDRDRAGVSHSPSVFKSIAPSTADRDCAAVHHNAGAVQAGAENTSIVNYDSTVVSDSAVVSEACTSKSGVANFKGRPGGNSERCS